MKKNTFIITYKLLLHIEDDLLYVNSIDEMHTRQGSMTHLTAETVFQFRTVLFYSADSFVAEIVDEIEKHIKTMRNLKI